MNAKNILKTAGSWLLAGALALIMVVLMTDYARADASDCDLYGIYIGADHKEAHDHFLTTRKGWGITGVETDPDNGVTTISYVQEFQNNISGMVSIMGANGQVIGIYVLMGTNDQNGAGLKEMAKAMADGIAAESIICGAEVSTIEINGTTAYYAERDNGTATLYRVEKDDGVTAITKMFGPSEIIHAMMTRLAQ